MRIVKTSIFSFILSVSLSNSFAQKAKEVFSLKLGYSTTNIVFKEAIVPDINFFGIVIGTGKSFAGNGPEFGICKTLNDHIFIDLSFSAFADEDIHAQVNNKISYYKLKGFQVPLTANHLFRDNKKKLRINLGAGFQYVKAHLQQFEIVINNSGGQTKTQTTDISISEIQLTLRPGLQFRIIKNLFASFIVDASLSATGRYSDHPCFSLKYAFVNKKQH